MLGVSRRSRAVGSPSEPRFVPKSGSRPGSRREPSRRISPLPGALCDAAAAHRIADRVTRLIGPLIHPECASTVPWSISGMNGSPSFLPEASSVARISLLLSTSMLSPAIRSRTARALSLRVSMSPWGMISCLLRSHVRQVMPDAPDGRRGQATSAGSRPTADDTRPPTEDGT